MRLGLCSYTPISLTIRRRTNQQSDLRLPFDVSELESIYDVCGESSTASNWDFVWTSSTEEGREKGLLQNAFCAETDFPPLLDQDASEAIRVAESALKVGKPALCTRPYT